MKGRLNCYFDAALLKRLDELAARRGLSKSTIVEAALASFLSPDAADQRERNPVHPRSPAIRASQPVCVEKNVLPTYLVVEQVEADSGFGLRFTVPSRRWLEIGWRSLRVPQPE